MRRKYIVGGIFVTALIVFLWIYLPLLSRHQDLKFQVQKLDQEIQELNAKIEKLDREKVLLQDDSVYLEKVVRNELGLVKPGEIVYKLVQDEKGGLHLRTPPLEPASEIAPSRAITPTPEKWPQPKP